LLAREELDAGLAAAVRAGDWYLTAEQLEELRYGVAKALDARAAASALDPGIPVAELLPQRPWAAALMPLLPIERRGATAFAPGATAGLGDRAEAADRLEDELDEAGYTPVKVDDAELARFLEAAGRLIRLGDGLAIGVAAYEEARRLLVEECSTAGSITLARFRDLLGAGRKQAQLLLERFDADGLTRRVGDERVLRRKAKSG
jgi:selenocysteine-specific elongation factor